MVDVKEYIPTEDNRIIEAPPVEDMCEAILAKYNRMMKKCEELWIRNEHLRSEAYKDEELKKWRDSYLKLVSDVERGFPITKEEYEKILEFVHKHDEMHGKSGTIGGRYTYSFLPTSIGTIGTLKCNSCEEVLVFRELD